jgi:hypothetical protein
MAFLFRIPKVAGSIQGPKTDFPQIFSGFLSPPIQMLNSTLDHYHVFPHYFPVTIHK